MKRKGSITIYFALVMAVIVPLILAQITSAKVSAGRMQAANSMDQALFSLLGHYYGPLAKEYGLLFLNAGGSGSGPDLEAVITSLEDSMDYILEPNKGFSVLTGKNLLNLKREAMALTAFTLATDAGGAPFRAQAIRCMKDTVGLEAVSLLQEELTVGKNAEETGKGLLNDSESVSYNDIENMAAEAAESDSEGGGGESGGDGNDGGTETGVEVGSEEGGSGDTEESSVPDDFVNPLPILEQLQSLTVLNLVVPDPSAIPSENVDKSELVSGRDLASGAGLIEIGEAGDNSDPFFKAWIITHFRDFTDPSSHSAYKYQKEYLLNGKKSDRANLNAVVTTLLLTREAVNMFCLLTDEIKSAELSTLSLMIATFLTIPEAEAIIKLVLAAGWAYAESLVDVRALLEGKRVPYVKDSSSWQTDAEGLAKSGGSLDGLTEDCPWGMRYSHFLDALLLASGDKKLTMRCMDIVESEIRGQTGSDFRLDSCIGALTAEAEMRAERKVTFPVEMSASYMDL